MENCFHNKHIINVLRIFNIKLNFYYLLKLKKKKKNPENSFSKS